ncbi:hypothetical protein DPMN_025137 [Dreissena polymorpha]|uniref:Uncharacterized protein n=1 Tax=Dreissena polymorpha TaxID=45954 RepID=A0A9D4RBE3_DREPO|nr:hypothetical protein DPMN_025137 [Dreissena polymorpha]
MKTSKLALTQMFATGWLSYECPQQKLSMLALTMSKTNYMQAISNCCPKQMTCSPALSQISTTDDVQPGSNTNVPNKSCPCMF